MEARTLILSYFPDRAEFRHSVKSTDTSAIETFILASHIALKDSIAAYWYANHKFLHEKSAQYSL